MADGIGITPGLGATAATDDVSGQHYQRVKRTSGGDGLASDFLDKVTRNDTFTVTGQGATCDVAFQGMSEFSMQVAVTGAGTPTWTVVLEGSLNNSTFTTILTHTNTLPGDGKMQFTGAVRAPCLYYRSRVSALSLGGSTNIVVTVLGKP